MFRRDSSGAERALAERFRREALATRPAFSARLHERIGRAIRQREGHRPLVPRRIVRGPAPVVWIPATAVAVGVLVVAVAWLSVGDGWPFGAGGPELGAGTGSGLAHGTVSVDDAVDPTSGVHALTAIPGRAVVEIDRLVDAAITGRRWAYLDHDALLAARVLIDPLPLDLLATSEADVDGL